MLKQVAVISFFVIVQTYVSAGKPPFEGFDFREIVLRDDEGTTFGNDEGGAIDLEDPISPTIETTTQSDPFTPASDSDGGIDKEHVATEVVDYFKDMFSKIKRRIGIAFGASEPEVEESYTI